MVARIDWLEVGFLIMVGTMALLAGLFGLYVLAGLIRNTGFRRRRAR